MEKIDLWDLDISQHAETGSKLTLHHPVSQQALAISLYLKGQDAPSYRRVIRKQIDWQISEGKSDLTAAEMERHHIERLAAATIGWDEVLYKGAPLPFTEENAKTLYSEQIWIREQVQQFIEERANFLKD